MLRKAFWGALLALTTVGPALALSTEGYNTIIRLPIVASTSTYTSTIFIHNPVGFGSGTINVRPIYIGATGTPTGQVNCPDIPIAQGATVAVNLASACPLVAGSNFGQLYLYEVDAANHPFSAYSRVEAFSGNGFSIEGFSPGAFHNNGPNPVGDSYVTGLRRQAAAPTYQTNCFMGALENAVNVDVALFNGSGVQIGSAANYALLANQTIRVLDIFTALGAPAVDYSNVTARFFENGAGEGAFIAYCTVQNNTSFDADFRIAKVTNSTDIRFNKFQSASSDALGNAFQVTSSALKNIHVAYMNQPDWVACQLTGANVANLEMQLKNPAGVVVAGGNAVNAFPEIYLGGNDNAVGGGTAAGTGRWFIEVSSTGLATIPATYGIQCQSGNGMTPFDQIGTAPDDF